MVLMLWLYLTGLSLIIGGEINAFLYRNIYFLTQRKQSDSFYQKKRFNSLIEKSNFLKYKKKDAYRHLFLYAFTYSSNLSSKFSQAPNRRFIYRSASWKDLKD